MAVCIQQQVVSPAQPELCLSPQSGTEEEEILVQLFPAVSTL